MPASTKTTLFYACAYEQKKEVENKKRNVSSSLCSCRSFHCTASQSIPAPQNCVPSCRMWIHSLFLLLLLRPVDSACMSIFIENCVFSLRCVNHTIESTKNSNKKFPSLELEWRRNWTSSRWSIKSIISLQRNARCLVSHHHVKDA